MSVRIMTSAGRTGIDEPPGITPLSLRPSRIPPAISSSFANGVPGHGEDLRAAVVRPPERKECISAVVDDPGNRGEGLGIVDRRRLAVETEARGKRRLESRQALLALQRLEQRGLLAADVGAVTVVVVELEREIAAEDVFPDEAGATRLGERFLAALVDVPDLPVDVVVARADPHRVGGDRHAFDDDMRVVAQYVAVLEGPGLALVRIAHQIFRARKLARHEAPLEARRKTRPAAPAQRGLFHLTDKSLRRRLLGEDLLQRR